MAVQIFSGPSLHERMCLTWGSNSGPLACQADTLPIKLPCPAQTSGHVKKTDLKNYPHIQIASEATITRNPVFICQSVVKFNDKIHVCVAGFVLIAGFNARI